MQSGQLQYYLHDDLDAFRFELAGSLSGAAVESVYHAWRTALSVITNRKVIVDITFVNKADEQGRRLLKLWLQKGARIIARSPQASALAADIAGEATPGIPAIAPEKNWLARFIMSLFRPAVTFANNPAVANKSAGGGGDGEGESSDLNALSRSPGVAARVP